MQKLPLNKQLAINKAHIFSLRIAMSSDSAPTSNSQGMIFIEDTGSLFDASVDTLWKYLFAGEAHDKAHHSTRNSSFKPLTKTSFIFSSERNLNGRWAPESLRMNVFPPLGMSTEMLEGPLAGSKMFYLYSPKGNKTQIDVFGEFKSEVFPADQLEQIVPKFLEGEFNEDVPAIRDFAKHNKPKKKSSLIFMKDVGGMFDAPLDTVWNYFFNGGEEHDGAHKNTRNFKMESASGNSSVFSSEHKRHGRWTKETLRMTNFAPLGYVFEMLKGPHSGSKMLYVYVPKGNKTQVDVYGYLKSRSTPPSRLKREVLDDLKRDYDEDAPVLKAFARKN
jgi:hypothetical protein